MPRVVRRPIRRRRCCCGGRSSKPIGAEQMSVVESILRSFSMAAAFSWWRCCSPDGPHVSSAAEIAGLAPTGGAWSRRGSVRVGLSSSPRWPMGCRRERGAAPGRPSCRPIRRATSRRAWRSSSATCGAPRQQAVRCVHPSGASREITTAQTASLAARAMWRTADPLVRIDSLVEYAAEHDPE